MVQLLTTHHIHMAQLYCKTKKCQRFNYTLHLHVPSTLEKQEISEVYGTVVNHITYYIHTYILYFKIK